jgi:putative Mn2+ efflux pump MntP
MRQHASPFPDLVVGSLTQRRTSPVHSDWVFSRAGRAGGIIGGVLVLLLVALSLGLSNFGAAIGIGVGGVGARTRMRIGIVFGLFEAGMPVAGLALGHSLASALGHAAHWIGGALLVATGAYSLIQVRRDRGHHDGLSSAPGQPIGRLLIIGAALSIDNLAVGFALVPTRSTWS